MVSAQTHSTKIQKTAKSTKNEKMKRAERMIERYTFALRVFQK